MRAGNCAFSRDANANVFGRDVDVTGTTALVGAANAGAAGIAGQGAAYVFDESDGVWTETEKLVASDGSANQNFGIAAGVSGSNTLVGVYRAAVGTNPEQCAAYFYASGAGDVIFADGFDGG